MLADAPPRSTDATCRIELGSAANVASEAKTPPAAPRDSQPQPLRHAWSARMLLISVGYTRGWLLHASWTASVLLWVRELRELARVRELGSWGSGAVLGSGAAGAGCLPRLGSRSPRRRSRRRG